MAEHQSLCRQRPLGQLAVEAVRLGAMPLKQAAVEQHIYAADVQAV